MRKNSLFFLLLSWLLLLASCNEIQNPEFKKLGSFRLKRAGLENTDIGISVTYFNPNSFGVTVKEAEADVYVDSVYVGRFTQDHHIEVERKSDFSIPLTGSIPLMKLLELNLTDLQNREVAVKADGSVKVGKAGIYITHPFEYSGKHKIDVRL